jgi:hypothetical protein
MSDFPTVEEKYTSAIHASNLRVEADKGGSADVLIAVGWSPSRLGAALMRLHSEQDAAESLRSFAGVHEQLDVQASRWGMPVATTSAVLTYWLAPLCKACQGRKFETVPDSPALSAKRCGCCRGEGVARIPCGDDGRKLLGYIEDCLSRARDSIKARLRMR